jgi:hypothetical protein
MGILKFSVESGKRMRPSVQTSETFCFNGLATPCSLPVVLSRGSKRLLSVFVGNYSGLEGRDKTTDNMLMPLVFASLSN